VFSSVQR